MRASSHNAETSLKAQIADQARELRVLQDKLTQSAASLSAANEANATAARQHEEDVSALRKQLAQSQGEVASLRTERSTLVERISALQRENDSIQAQLADLKGQLAQSTSRLEALAREKATTEGIQAELVGSLRKQVQDKDLQITAMRDELRITMLGKVLFQPGNAIISTRGKAILKSLAEQLKKLHGVQIVVRGHTDDQPLDEAARAVYIDNLGLSVERAAAVGRTLRAMGVEPQHLSVAGFSMYQPVASNGTAEGRQENRRVEVALIPIPATQ